MTIDLEAANKVLAQIDRDELAQLGCDLTSIPSPTGQEKAIRELIDIYKRQFKQDAVLRTISHTCASF